MVVPYSISTSNHNSQKSFLLTWQLFLIRFLHQTTTLRRSHLHFLRCSLFDFYIKPQQWDRWTWTRFVVPYSISTSNHNSSGDIWTCAPVVPYSISTSNHNVRTPFPPARRVVPYSISTSNHNRKIRHRLRVTVVPYSISTSNHNCTFGSTLFATVVPYSISTSNHNL